MKSAAAIAWNERSVTGEDEAAAAAELLTGGDLLVRTLVDLGVDTIFGYPGGAIMPIYDSLLGVTDRLRHVLVRHEQGATHAAEGYARLCGKPAAVFATSGPGATNLVTGLADALMDSVPMICITGQVPGPLLGTDSFQEVDIVGIALSVTKWAYQIADAREVRAVLHHAHQIAVSGRPGPVLIDVTKDAQLQRISLPAAPRVVTRSKATYSAVALESAVALLNGSERPLILAGHGITIARAEAELRALAECGGIPVACTLHGLSAFPTSHRLFAGMLGMHGNYAPNVLTNRADVILALGMRFDDRVTGRASAYARQAKIIHVDVDNTQIGKVVPADVSLTGDVRQVLSVLLPRIERRDRAEWIERFHELRAVEEEKVIREALSSEENTLRMGQVVDALSAASRGRCVIVADVGQHQMAAARYYRFSSHRSFLSSGGLGTMGFALPAALGAAIAAPERLVVAIVGDGSFQMTMQELATIVQERLPVKVLILNNGYLGMIRQWQELFFERRYSFSDLYNPDFVKLGEAFGIPSARVTTPAELMPGLERMLASPGPYLLEAVVKREENVFPMVPAGAAVSEIRLE